MSFCSPCTNLHNHGIYTQDYFFLYPNVKNYLAAPSASWFTRCLKFTTNKPFESGVCLYRSISIYFSPVHHIFYPGVHVCKASMTSKYMHNNNNYDTYMYHLQCMHTPYYLLRLGTQVSSWLSLFVFVMSGLFWPVQAF